MKHIFFSLKFALMVLGALMSENAALGGNYFDYHNPSQFGKQSLQEQNVDGGCLTISIVESMDPSCFFNMDGVIEVSVTGGEGQIMYGLDPENLNSDTPIFTDLPGGSYIVYAEDEFGCAGQSEQVVLTAPNPLTVTLILSDPICYNDSSGYIEIFVSGGTGDYTFSFQGGDFLADDVWTGLTGGYYSIITMDENGCQGYVDGFLADPPAIEVSDFLVTPDSGSEDGSIEVTASGGNGALSYSWSGPNGFESEVEDIYDLISGNYILTITDESGCQIEMSFEVGNPTDIAGLSNTEFLVWPNPFADTFSISANLHSSDRLVIRDLLGKTVLDYDKVHSDLVPHEVNLSGYPDGVYIISVIDGNQEQSFRAIKQEW